MFSREVATVPPVTVCATLLPSRGSEHPAFVDMLFLWGAALEDHPMFRCIALPSGFSLTKTSEVRWEVVDGSGFPRAVVSVPTGRGAVPSIAPVRRFHVGADPLRGGYRGYVSDWDSIVYRTTVKFTQVDALSIATKWLDDNKPRWDSYTSAVNFERRP